MQCAWKLQSVNESVTTQWSNELLRRKLAGLDNLPKLCQQVLIPPEGPLVLD